MPVWRFKGLLQSGGWQLAACVLVDDRGGILEITSNPGGAKVDVEVDGYLIPGFRNAHSHAFQYGMAGMAEQRSPDPASDDFWTWREAMYRLALRLSPEQIEGLAAMLYAEMLRHGYTAVAEFHYMHRDPQGKAYANPAEIGERLIAAAKLAGIQLTLIPVYYRLGNFGTAARPEQRRFLSDSVEDFWRLVEATRFAIGRAPGVRLGIAVHSLRAAAPEEVIDIFSSAPKLVPLHIHLAEQRREVEGALAHLGQRSIDWFLSNLIVDQRYALIHATHASAAEVRSLAATGATVVFCPSTEGNLGDGVFPLRAYLDAGGRWAIGSDSQICLSPFEELRLLDYVQRLKLERRNVLCEKNGEESGAVSYWASLTNGRHVLGEERDEPLQPGAPLEGVVLDSQHPLLQSAGPSKILSRAIYAADPSALLGTIVHGEWVVYRGKHIRRDEIVAQYKKAGV